MPSLALNDVKLFAAGHDLSGQMNACALEYAADMLDETTFGATTRINKGGIKSVVANHQGFWDAGGVTAVDPVVFARVGLEDVPIVIGPEGGAVNALAYLFRAIHAEYAIGAGVVGELLPFSVAMEGTGGQPLVRGRVMHNASATGNVTGTGIQFGSSITATQFLYATLQVFSGSGAFVVIVQSAAAADFVGATTRITFATVATGTAVASEWATRVPGPITDTWWRVFATNPATRNFAVAIGIQ